jgi:hypothetical protein
MTRRDMKFGIELPTGSVSPIAHDDILDQYAEMAAWPGKPIRTTGGFTREVRWTTPQWWHTLAVLPLWGLAPDPRQHFMIGGNPVPGALTACLRRLATTT